ncbi:hypothetical protein [Streptomyces sp. NPDC001165]|uniref:hypothetical protein n=1 Tax=Streptomyces sp. NPDC001165 TaxID=3364546 RepID=UPI0036CCD6E9
MTALELRELRKTYRSRGRPAVEAVRGLDLGLKSGELLGLLGPSGCGKSGSPSRTTRSPASAFEADFVGEPAINLLPGTATADGHARLSAGVRLVLPVPVAEGRAVVVGIRPEDLSLTGAADGIPARVVAHEPLLEPGSPRSPSTR